MKHARCSRCGHRIDERDALVNGKRFCRKCCQGSSVAKRVRVAIRESIRTDQPHTAGTKEGTP